MQCHWSFDYNLCGSQGCLAFEGFISKRQMNCTWEIKLVLGADSPWTEAKACTPFSSSLRDLPFWDARLAAAYVHCWQHITWQLVLSSSGNQREWILNLVKFSFHIYCHCFIPQHVFILIAPVFLFTGPETLFHTHIDFWTLHCYTFLTNEGATFSLDAACTLLKVPEVIICVLKEKRNTQKICCVSMLSETILLLPLVATTTNAVN